MLGNKVRKDRKSLLFCSNPTGNFKSKPLCICRSASSRALKNVCVNKLPIIWRFSKTAWMTKVIFEDWFLNHLCPAVQCYCAMKTIAHKALLFLKNCNGYLTNLNDLQDIKVVLLPPNTTSLIQMMDQDVMCCFKLKYLELTSEKLHSAVTRDPELGVKEYWKKVVSWTALDSLARIGNMFHRQFSTEGGRSCGLQSFLT